MTCPIAPFTAEDFEHCEGYEAMSGVFKYQALANIANRRLQERWQQALDAMPVVYAQRYEWVVSEAEPEVKYDFEFSTVLRPGVMHKGHSTHKARLCALEKMEGEE